MLSEGRVVLLCSVTPLREHDTPLHEHDMPTLHACRGRGRSMSVAQFKEAHGLAPGHGPGVGDPVVDSLSS